MSERDDHWGDLLRRANRGDRRAYGHFLIEVTPVVRNIARARSADAPEDVEDIVQEALLALHDKRHTWREDVPVTPWIYAIVRYKAIDARRRRGMAHHDIADLAEVLADDSAGDIMASRDLSQLLGGIDDRSADIVRALGVTGESAGDVGAQMGMTEGAVRVAYHRALTRLRKLVGANEAQ
ncbi:sigma-70 family RNA polymerase sigma factor [Pseudooceanicola sediminis]|uniref:Sigma-70 family RNA polymerase sigma factor n=1 Tax=Pseudooceanicola sediminis TaxID=2211117 RepID=A0A399J5Y4_9RHOB|nr:sigma-70 family RNA polymerase sigma factor [Pseudooceanicola sediminis]KAA2314142.1 sigma-70 family RNA polymerase sigma factor [Puniceibacterium sp. HSS470]RII39997.1 sigma-70 family RNA polymerase sigma factor [Pseudooceanicola sediminis]|tara:strand:+ start:56677 stop:57219 length:543 start_codon:yes stop_codon:yes gene_type:complete